MVATVRRGVSMRQVARRFGVSLSVVQRWVARAAERRLDRVNWDGWPRGPRSPRNKIASETEARILELRRQLREQSDLGEYGAQAIQRALREEGYQRPPSLRTIGRILERRGALDGRYRVRRPPPPRGWYLPEVAAGRAELDSFDFIEGLHLQGGQEVGVLTASALHGGLVGAWPESEITAKISVLRLLEHWRTYGLPDYAQFDNDTRFQGPHHHPDTLGRITRLCLSLDITPVFVPPREPGFQAAIENFNGRWQAKVWARFHFPHLTALQAQSAKFVAAVHLRTTPRRQDAPARRPFPPAWQLNLQSPLRGQILFLRRTNDQGVVFLLGHAFEVDPHWPSRLVRVEMNLTQPGLRFYTLRRRDPKFQNLLREIPYHFPVKPFKD